MQKVLQSDGVNIELSAAVTSAAQKGDTISLTVQQNGEIKNINSDMLLIAAGRTPNSRGFGLASLGIDMDEKGYIRTNARQQTSVKKDGSSARDFRKDMRSSRQSSTKKVMKTATAICSPCASSHCSHFG